MKKRFLVGVSYGLVLLLVSIVSVYADERYAELPKQDEWFLSTGHWADDPQVYVNEVGKGAERVVMLHGGWGADHDGLIETTIGLEKNYRFVFYDQRGSLRSPFPDQMISFDEHIKDLERLREELSLDKMTLVGHSMGAVLASAYAERYKDRVKKLILISPAYLKYPIPDKDKSLQHKHYLQAKDFSNRKDVADELARFNLLRDTPPLTSQEETAKHRIEFARRMLFDVQKWPALRGGKSLFNPRVYPLTEKTYPESGWNFFDLYREAKFSVHIITGAQDLSYFGGDGLLEKWMLEAPSVKLVNFDECGHFPWIDQPKKFHTEFKKALKF